MQKNDNIKRLMETVRELEQTEDNKRRKEKWECIPYTSRDQWRGLPKLDGSCLKGNVPVQVDANNTFWGKYYNFSLKDYYLNGEVFLENFLKATIERFKLFDDDVFINRRIPIWMASGYEASFFGMKVNFFDNVDPWIEFKDVIETHEDLKSLKLPDFYKSGMMPKTLEVYEYAKENLDDDFEAIFPEWQRGPFGIAVYLRGFENLLMDMIDSPDFVHELMRFIVDSRKAWFDDLEKYLGKPVVKANLYNDEVNCPSLSPMLYKEFVLPYEKELSDYHGGLHYWHSCGDLDPLYKLIAEIPKIDMIHKSPWSSALEVGKVFGKTSAIEVCMNPQKDIFEGTEEYLRELLTGIVKDLTDTGAQGYTLRANNIMFYESWDNSISRARMFINVAREVVDKITR